MKFLKLDSHNCMSKQTNNKIVTAFGPVVNPPKQCHDPVDEVDIIDTLIIDTYETDEERNVRPVTKQIVTGKKNRREYIESFSDDVGLENILQKIGQGAIAEDKYSILKSNPAGQVNDLRGFQDIDNLGDIQILADKARVTFANLDPELKKNMSFAEFCSKFNNQALTDYVTAKAKAKEKPNEGEVK